MATAVDQTAFMQPGLDTQYATYPAQNLTPASSDRSLNGDLPTPTSNKRKEPPLPSGQKPVKKAKADSKTELPNGDKDGEAASKPKRVRTGCLTCRERHLKCDEGLPHCNNCKKSNRVCKRGVRLNFIDTWTEQPPVLLSLQGTSEWKVVFFDESRDIASEYQGGRQRYARLDEDMHSLVQMDPRMQFDYTQVAPQAPNMSHQSLPSIHGPILEVYPEPPPAPEMSNMYDPFFKQDSANNHLQPPHSGSTVESHHSGNSNHSGLRPGSVGSYDVGATGLTQTEHDEHKDYIDNADETLSMQVFVEEVGVWMDSMDPNKHFSRLLPFHSLSEPMLLNAFLACGARHLTLVNPTYSEEKALHYYDTATRYLLKNLQDPNRDTVICATTAVILNVYEIMSERALQRMNHIAGARALIKECGWNARSTGVGSACFWLNVGLEVLSCLRFNWQVAWDPDEWGVDMDFSRELHNGREEIWTHRMLYISARICNFRATIPPYNDSEDPKDRQARTQQRYDEWCRLKSMADAWNDGIPRTMHPMAFLYPYQTGSKSHFPEVWLVKRSTIVARLFYHSAQLFLAQINPYYPPSSNAAMADLQTRHSQMICGIAAHVNDRGVASVAIRSLAHAAEVLTDRAEQEEVLHVLKKINKQTGWRIGYVYQELREKWGWGEAEVSPEEFLQTHTGARQRDAAQRFERAMQAQQLQQQQQQQQQGLQHQGGFEFDGRQGSVGGGIAPTLQPPAQTTGPPTTAPPVSGGAGAGAAAAPRKMPQGIPNPMYAKADFNLPQHPYQNFYVAPNHVSVEWNPEAAGGGGHGQGHGAPQQAYYT